MNVRLFQMIGYITLKTMVKAQNFKMIQTQGKDSDEKLNVILLKHKISETMIILKNYK